LLVPKAIELLSQAITDATTKEKKEEDAYLLANEWMEIKIAEVVSEKSWLKISEPLLLHILALPRLNISEDDLFKAVVEWGKYQINGCSNNVIEEKTDIKKMDGSKDSHTTAIEEKQMEKKDEKKKFEEKEDTIEKKGNKKKDIEKKVGVEKKDFEKKKAIEEKEIDLETLKKVLIKAIPLIRFPTISPLSLAMEVRPTDLLTSTQMVQLFRYAGDLQVYKKNKDDDEDEDEPEPGKDIKHFNFEERNCRRIGFIFDPKKKSIQLTLSNGNRTVRKCAGDNRYSTVSCTQWITKGKHKIKFKIDKNNGLWIFLGIVTKNYKGYSSVNGSHIGHASNTGYSITSGGGTAYSYPGGYRCGTVFRTGDTMVLMLDMDA